MQIFRLPYLLHVVLQTVDDSIEPVILIDNGAVLGMPTAGHHIVEISLGEVIDVVVINEHGNAFNGDLT